MLNSKFIHSFNKGNSIYCTYLVNNFEDRKKSFSFVYDSYISNSLGQENNYGMWFSIYELLPTSLTIIIKKDNLIVASASIIKDSKYGIPIDDGFKSYLDSNYRNKDRIVCEVYSLSVAKTNNSNEILSKLLNYITIVTYYYFKATDTLITVVPRHSRFYEKKLNFYDYNLQGYHKKTRVECKLLIHPNQKKIHDNIKINPRSLFKEFEPPKIEKSIVSSIYDKYNTINYTELEFFCKLKNNILNSLTKEKQILINNYINTIKRGAK